MKYTLSLMITLFLSFSNLAQAQETQLMIRAKAVDAKFIGTSVGGVRIVVTDAETDEVLDEGWINGRTGDTTLLMKTPIKRGEALTNNKTAGFIATLDLNAPRFLKITAIGPYGFRQSLQQASVTTWAIPGKHMLGDGITIDMPGFIVDAWTRVLEGGKVEIYTKASMLCGCPITEDGLWNANDYEVKAILMQDEKVVKEVPLMFTGPVGMFSAKTDIKTAGHYKAIVYIIDEKTANVGVDRTMFEVELD